MKVRAPTKGEAILPSRTSQRLRNTLARNPSLPAPPSLLTVHAQQGRKTAIRARICTDQTGRSTQMRHTELSQLRRGAPYRPSIPIAFPGTDKTLRCLLLIPEGRLAGSVPSPAPPELTSKLRSTAGATWLPLILLFRLIRIARLPRRSTSTLQTKQICFSPSSFASHSSQEASAGPT